MVIFYKRLADRTRYQIVYNITLGFLAAAWLVLFFDNISSAIRSSGSGKRF
jgi:hypothetical protein